MKHKMWSRLLSMVLAVMMITSIVPTSAHRLFFIRLFMLSPLPLVFRVVRALLYRMRFAMQWKFCKKVPLRLLIGQKNAACMPAPAHARYFSEEVTDQTPPDNPS